MRRFAFQDALSEKQRATFSERLLKLRNLLLALPPEQYRHSTWVTSHSDCGTVACAAGHAMVNKRLFPGFDINYKFHANAGGSFEDRHGNYVSMFDAIRDYFGEDTGHSIFGVDDYENINTRVTTRVVSARIKKFVREAYGYEPA